MPAICGLCNAKESRYKCPTCEVPYCSLACYKPHKAAHLSGALPAPVPAATSSADATANPQPPKAPEHKFAGLAEDPAIRQLLADPELRKKLWDVYSTGKDQKDKWRAEGKDPQLEKLNKLRGEDARVGGLVERIVGLVAEKETEKKNE